MSTPRRRIQLRRHQSSCEEVPWLYIPLKLSGVRNYDISNLTLVTTAATVCSLKRQDSRPLMTVFFTRSTVIPMPPLLLHPDDKGIQRTVHHVFTRLVFNPVINVLRRPLWSLPRNIHSTRGLTCCRGADPLFSFRKSLC